MSSYNRSQRSSDWAIFSHRVNSHIENYAVPQYGDKGHDIASEKDAEFCVDAIKKYIARFGKNKREGQDKLDFLKIAHYAQMAHDSISSQKN
jgi:hypothetical protein